VWFNRDEEGYALLNVRMPQSSPSQRVRIEDNFWVQRGNAADVVCPPGGKSLEVSCRNGDYLLIRFEEVPDDEALQKLFPNGGGSVRGELPFTSVEVVMRVPGLGLSLHTGGVGETVISGGVLKRNRIGLQIDR
jgi:hypothetical protein